MPHDPDVEKRKIVRQVAARYARRAWWAELEDLEQEAALAAEQALRTFDPRVGVPVEGYLWRAVVCAVKRHLWKMSAPVSGGTHRPEVQLAGLHRAQIAADDYEDDKPRGHVLRSAHDPEWSAADHEWRALVLDRLLELADGDRAAVASVLGDPAALTAESRAVADRVQREMKTDLRLYELARELANR